MKMKTSKSNTSKVLATPNEECGVWLDAAELRTKKQKKRVTRPISKLLNPLARSGGYSMAVALNFTQTKMEMPATKQSTISAFFQPRSKMIKNTDECCPHPSEISFTPHTEVHDGTKRKRVETTASTLDEVTGHTFPVHLQELNVDLQSGSVKSFADQTKKLNFFHLMWGHESEELEPAEKRRPTEDDYNESGTQVETQKECKKDIFHAIQHIPETLLHTEQVEVFQEDSQQVCRKFSRTDKGRSLAPCSANESPSREKLKAHHLMDKNISCQRPIQSSSVTENQHMVKQPHKVLELPEQKHYHHYTRWSTVNRNDKENGGPTSPTPTTSGSPHMHMPASSPVKRFSKFGNPSIIQKEWHHQSPKKTTKTSLENEQDSSAMLFTQDSEGFRVIANRNKQTRCPLRDRTNSAESRDNWNLPSEKSLETEDSESEPEMLFTQDSQGNIVIKH